MTSEKRSVRPYVDLDPFQTVLDRSRVRIAGRTIEPGHRLIVGSNSFRHDPLTLAFAPDDDGVETLRSELAAAATAIEVDLSEIELVVLARTPYLKLCDVVHQKKLSDPTSVPNELTMFGDPDDLRPLLTPSGGCEIEVALCLADDLPPKPLRPRRHGTWLARVEFAIRTELDELGFTPRPLTPEERERLQLAADTIRFVDVTPDALLSEEIDDAIELYLDDAVLAVLNSAPNTPSAMTFQRQLFLDVVAAVVRAAPQVPDFMALELTDLEHTILGRILDSASPSAPGESAAQKLSRRETSLLMLKNDPERLMANIENTVAPRDDLLTTLAGAED